MDGPTPRLESDEACAGRRCAEAIACSCGQWVLVIADEILLRLKPAFS